MIDGSLFQESDYVYSFASEIPGEPGTLKYYNFDIGELLIRYESSGLTLEGMLSSEREVYESGAGAAIPSFN